MERLRVVTWNMARAVRPKGLDGDPWEVLQALSPQVALLQEAQLPPAGFPGHFHLNRTRKGWGTAIWSSLELTTLGSLPDGGRREVVDLLPALSGYTASAELRLSGGRRMEIVSVHAYPAAVKEDLLGATDPETLKTQNAKAVWPGDLVWWLTRDLPTPEGLALIGGDWNTSRRFDEVYGPRGNQDFFQRMSDTGWKEALRKFEKSEVRTYFRDGRGPYQLDHVFVSPALYGVLKRGGVVAGDDVLATSDHAPIVLDFEL